jgi:glycosyltransferase involved in cell wall biosynthesis
MIERFRHAEIREPPPPRAVFTSNPLRGLDWLLDLWVKQIRPAVPQAELHIYAGPAVYGGLGSRAGAMEAVLARAEALGADGVFRYAPVGRDALVEVLKGARAMLYRGDPGETFCLALAEAQAMGVPAVVTPLGAVAERIADGVSGRIADSDDAFVEASIAVLRDDALWRRWHQGALAGQRGLSWDEIAARYEALIP